MVTELKDWKSNAKEIKRRYVVLLNAENWYDMNLYLFFNFFFFATLPLLLIVW